MSESPSAGSDAVRAIYEVSYSRLVGVVSLAAGGRAEAEECVEVAEIAAELDIAPGTVKSRLSRARQTLSPLLREEAFHG